MATRGRQGGKRCSAITLKGTRCPFAAKTGGLCGVHQNSRPKLGEQARGRRDHVPANEDARQRWFTRRTAKLEAALSARQPTDTTHYDPDTGRWDAGRARLHAEIVDDLWARHGENVPRQGKALMAGGLGGAGKSTALRNRGIPSGEYLTVNPDDVKEEMARRGMIPNLPGLSPMEASALVHEESSHIAGMLATRAYQQQTNLIWDITMSSPSSVSRRLDDLEQAGYTHVGAIFVDIPVDMSVERATGRYQRGVTDYANNGKGLGGRYVPPKVIRANTDPEFSSKNRRTFEQYKERFDGWEVYDSRETPPRKIAERGQIR